MEKGFQFRTVPAILSEPGLSSRLGEILKDRLQASKLLVVTDPGIVAAHLLDPVRSGLAASGLDFVIFDHVVADPPEDMILEIVDLARQHEVDAVLGFGGGSSMDAAKVAALLAGSDQPIETCYGVGNATGPRLPLALMPTTAGTGSEVTDIAVITTGETTKAGIVSPVLMADLALLDADLTLGLPRHVTAATGIDAMVHAIEAYTSKRLKNPLSDGAARDALGLLAANLLTTCNDPGNREARAAMLLGALRAGQAFANAPCAAVHALAYPLGGIFHIPHGLSNALVLPHVLRFNAPEAGRLYTELSAVAFPDKPPSAETLIAGLRELHHATGLPHRLRDVGISHNNLPRLAEDAMKQTRLLINNPREVTVEDALAIYEAAW